MSRSPGDDVSRGHESLSKAALRVWLRQTVEDLVDALKAGYEGLTEFQRELRKHELAAMSDEERKKFIAIQEIVTVFLEDERDSRNK